MSKTTGRSSSEPMIAAPSATIDQADESPTISLVIPTRNEEEGIGECIDRAKAAFADLGVTAEIIVSDSSTDRTPQFARENGARVVHPDQEGYGYAYLFGFARARGDIVAMGDGDTTYDFRQLPALVRRLRETDADIVLGSRLDGEIRDGAMPALHRYVGNPVLTWFLNAFYDADVTDAHSGLRVFHAELLEVLDLGAHGMEFASEMIMRASAAGLTIEEVPITYERRTGQAELDTYGDGWRHVKFMLMNAPSYLFAGPGTGLFAGGMVMMVLSLAGIELGGVTFQHHTMIAGSALLGVGYQVGALAAFTTVVSDPINPSEDTLTCLIRDEFTLERGLSIGGGLFMTGASIATVLVGLWAFGAVANPSIVMGLVALTAVILGLQTIFYSFFLSILAGRTPQSADHVVEGPGRSWTHDPVYGMED